ncbi:MAG: hypothetical protein U1C50_04090 [Patescibacteria group bacterium]|nr:hypothetical protein [Candidatus Beckwithbacteria bacterium]MDZ4229402.1 hypothetical protein [Patescibacteria group bacterium]
MPPKCEVFQVAQEAAPVFGVEIPATCPLNNGCEGKVSCLGADPTGNVTKEDVIGFLQTQMWGAQQVKKFLARLAASQ